MRALRLLPLLCLAGCYGGRIDAPSLRPRAVEQQPIALPDPASEPDSAIDPALAPRLAEIVASAEAGHRRFEEEQRATRAALEHASGAREGSEAWIAGEQAKSALAAARTPVNEAAAAVDALRVDPAYAGPRSRAAIDAAAARIQLLASAEEAAAGD